MNEESGDGPVVRVASGAARGIGNVIVGPALAAALSTPEMRRASRGVAVQLGVAVGLGVAIGIWLGKAVSR